MDTPFQKYFLGSDMAPQNVAPAPEAAYGIFETREILIATAECGGRRHLPNGDSQWVGLLGRLFRVGIYSLLSASLTLETSC